MGAGKKTVPKSPKGKRRKGQKKQGEHSQMEEEEIIKKRKNICKLQQETLFEKFHLKKV